MLLGVVYLSLGAVLKQLVLLAAPVPVGGSEKKISQNITSEDPLFFDLGEPLDWNSARSLMVLATTAAVSIHCCCDLTGRWYLGVGEKTPKQQSLYFQALFIIWETEKSNLAELSAGTNADL